MCGGFAGRPRVVNHKPALPRLGAWFQLWPTQFYGGSEQVRFCTIAPSVDHSRGGACCLSAHAEPVDLPLRLVARLGCCQPATLAAARSTAPFSDVPAVSLAASRLAAARLERVLRALRVVDSGFAGALGRAPAPGSHPRPAAAAAERIRAAEHPRGVGAPSVR